MLVFRRQQGESFMVGDAIEVRILEIGRSHVKIGVVAPKEVSVYRSEISQLNRRAARQDLKDPQVLSAIAALQKSLNARTNKPQK